MADRCGGNQPGLKVLDSLAIDLRDAPVAGTCIVATLVTIGKPSPLIRQQTSARVRLRVQHPSQLTSENLVEVTEHLVVADRALHRRRCLVAIEALRPRFNTSQAADCEQSAGTEDVVDRDTVQP